MLTFDEWLEQNQELDADDTFLAEEAWGYVYEHLQEKDRENRGQEQTIVELQAALKKAISTQGNSQC